MASTIWASSNVSEPGICGTKPTRSPSSSTSASRPVVPSAPQMASRPPPAATCTAYASTPDFLRCALMPRSLSASVTRRARFSSMSVRLPRRSRGRIVSRRTRSPLVTADRGELDSDGKAFPVRKRDGSTMSLTIAQLPVRLTPLVGRESELDGVVAALDRSRLLTLVGPGGTGKTRLALAAARTADPSFPAGVCWVALAQVNDPAVVGQTVAAKLGAPDTPGQDAVEAVAEHVGDHKVLLVLDNCEHLAEAAAAMVEYVLAACPALVVLATSREALGVEGEVSWPVPPLSLPRADSAPTAAGLAGSDAVKLFEQRAQLVRPAFRVTDENAAAVLSICQRLDGLPLAIELAAARMRILSSAQLAERMDDIFAVLVGGARSAPPRHQALRATLDWSYDLLDTNERATFRRLATFFGGFTLHAAERIAAGGDIRPDAMLELLTRLLDKSLLRVEYTRSSESRYFLLATVRDYARERLAEAAESDRARQAHLQYFTELVEDATARIEQVEAAPGRLERELDRLDAELPNLRRAFEFAQERGDPVAPLRIAGPLDRYAYLRGRYHEVRQWMDAAVTSCPDAPAGLRAKALLGGGRLALLQCDYAPAVRRLEAALRLYRELGD